jgi:hypothetical protein
MDRNKTKKMKIVGIVICALLIPIIAGLYGLGLFKFFAPMKRDIDRKVFENIKSYVHGVQQDLGKYYHEYQTADEAGKEVIKATIRMRFAEIDVDKLQSRELRMFLKKTRGY